MQDIGRRHGLVFALIGSGESTGCTFIKHAVEIHFNASG